MISASAKKLFCKGHISVHRANWLVSCKLNLSPWKLGWKLLRFAYTVNGIELRYNIEWKITLYLKSCNASLQNCSKKVLWVKQRNSFAIFYLANGLFFKDSVQNKESSILQSDLKVKSKIYIFTSSICNLIILYWVFIKECPYLLHIA